MKSSPHGVDYSEDRLLGSFCLLLLLLLMSNPVMICHWLVSVVAVLLARYYCCRVLLFLWEERRVAHFFMAKSVGDEVADERLRTPRQVLLFHVVPTGCRTDGTNDVESYITLTMTRHVKQHEPIVETYEVSNFVVWFERQ